MRKGAAILLLAALASMFVASSGGAAPGPESRATTVTGSDGTYYIFAYGNEDGPTTPGSHGIAIYKETNGVDAATCPQWKEGLPVGHVFVPAPGDADTGLQTAVSACAATTDEKLADTSL